MTAAVSLDPDKAAASSSIEQFGYRQELKRSLGLFDLTVYGLVFISPTAFGIFGIVFNASAGMVPLIYLLGLVAMLFTAASYVLMSRVFPIAGSVYAYAGRAIGEGTGFLAGWAMLLDYLLLPTLAYVLAALAIHSVLPGVPQSVCVVVLLAVNTAINLLGIETTARMNVVFLGLSLAILTIFMVAGVTSLIQGTAGAHLSVAPFFNAGSISSSMIFGGLSLALLSFLGFDAISTLAEETKGATAIVGKATLLSLCVAGLLFVSQTYIASLFVLDRTSFPPGEPTDTAFYEIAATIGGPWLKGLVSLPIVLFGIMPVALAAQVATARLLFSMARDGKLPRSLAHVHAKRRVPDRAVLVVAAVTLGLGLTLVSRLDLVTSMVNFGALVGFLLLHVSVMVHFMWRQKSKDWLRHLLVPLIGFAIIASVLFNMAALAKIAGIAWLSVGLVALIGLKLSGRRATLPVSG